MRTDKAKNMKALKTELLKNPLQTEEQLWEKLWVHRVTVNRLKEEMHEIVTNAKNDDILAITWKDREIIDLSQEISLHKLRWYKKLIDEWIILDIEMRDVKTVSEIAKESTARYALFKWDATDNEWGLKNPEVIFQIINPNGETEDTGQTD